MIKLVTLDLDNTLWDAMPVIVRAEQALQDWIGKHLPECAERCTPEYLWAARGEILQSQPRLRSRLSSLRRLTLEHCLRQCQVDGASELAQIGFAVFMKARHQLELNPQTLPLLRELSSDYQLVALSNGNADIARLGLMPPFKHLVNAQNTGYAKPDVRIFQIALSCAGVMAEDAVHIGDHPLEDVQAARDAEMHAIWFNPEHANWSEATEPPLQVQSLDEIPALMLKF